MVVLGFFFFSEELHGGGGGGGKVVRSLLSNEGEVERLGLMWWEVSSS